MEVFDTKVKSYLGFLDNQYVSAGLTLFLILYAGAIAPKLPARVLKLFDNVLVKLAMFFLIIFVSKKNPTVAIVASVAVLASLMTLNRLKLEGMVNTNQEVSSMNSGLNNAMYTAHGNIDSESELLNEPSGVDPCASQYEELSTHEEIVDLPHAESHAESHVETLQEQSNNGVAVASEASVSESEGEHTGEEHFGNVGGFDNGAQYAGL